MGDVDWFGRGDVGLFGLEQAPWTTMMNPLATSSHGPFTGHSCKAIRVGGANEMKGYFHHSHFLKDGTAIGLITISSC
jgi:hypothetical protein